MLNENRLYTLVYEEEADFITTESDQSSAEADLSEICDLSEVEVLRQYMYNQYGIHYWLAVGDVRVNPTRTYTMWISRTRGENPYWGLRPNILGPEELPENKEARDYARFLENHPHCVRRPRKHA